MSNNQRLTLGNLFVEPMVANEPKLLTIERELPQVVTTSFRLPVQAHKRLKALAFDEECKIHSLYLEAVDLLLRQRGQPSIAELRQVEGGS